MLLRSRRLPSFRYEGPVRVYLRSVTFTFLVLACVVALLAPCAYAQGVLVVTPGRTAASVAGNGQAGFAGDGGPASAALLSGPSCVARDAAGNLFVADTNNHVVREITPAGVITTVAGTGVAGFSGDGGAATSAQLDTPAGVAIDTSGNIFIADSHNNRIRKVSAAGVMTTLAGTGTAGFAGDNGAATSAQLSLPQGVAVDANGNIYIADTNNQRIREVSGTTILTIAGTGEQNYTGDGAAAVAAALDSPTAVAVDASGNIFVADRHNQRVREIAAATGTITTVAGSGIVTFTGSFGGDGGPASAASLSRPTGVSVDAAGNVYIADTDNQRVRTVVSGGIATVAGTGEQGFAGDGGPLSAAVLDTPKSAVADASAELYVADKGNQRVRSAADATLAFGTAAVGVASQTQTVTLSNTGSAGLTVSSVFLSTPYVVNSTSTCGGAPLTLAAGASCTEVLALVPTSPGSANGSISFSGAGIAPQTVLLTGSGTQAAASVEVTSNVAAPFIGQNITFTAKITPPGIGTATGTITFYANGVQLGSPQTVSGNSATLTTSFTAGGTYSITAMYSGDANFQTSTSAAYSQVVGDFNFTITPQPGQPSMQSVVPGQSVSFNLLAAPLAGPFSFPITLSATGLPPGATASFTPQQLTLGSAAVPFTMTVHVPAQSGALRGFGGLGATAVAVLLLPICFRRRGGKLQALAVWGFALLTAGALAGLTGCGTNSGFFGSQQTTYTINIVGTATNAQGAIVQHVATVQLTVQ